MAKAVYNSEKMCQGAVNVHGQAICNCHLEPKAEGINMPKNEKANGTPADELVRAAVSATGEAPNRAVKRRVRQRLHKKLGAVLNKEDFDHAMESFHTAVEAQRLQQEEELRAQKNRGAPVPPGSVLTAGPRAKAGCSAPAFVAVPVVMVPAQQQPGRVPMPMTAPNGFGSLAAPGMTCSNTWMGPPPPMPNLGPMPGAVLCAVQDVKQVQERVRISQMPLKTGPIPQKAGPFHFFGNQPNGFYAATQEDSDGESIGQGVKFQRARSEGCEGSGENLPVERTFIQFSGAGDSSKRSRSQ